MAETKLNLGRASVVVVDADAYTRMLTLQMLRGLGCEKPTVFEQAQPALDHLLKIAADFCLIEPQMPDLNGYELIRTIRRTSEGPNRFIPFIVFTGFTRPAEVARARDCGATTVVKKPASARALFDHIAWAALSKRPFVQVGEYVGPDRRFKSSGPPGGVGRRSTDLSPEIGAAEGPNLSQQEIDALLKPTKVVVA
ncbi:MAG: response regulator [Alphaproteobacteria bacterium]